MPIRWTTSPIPRRSKRWCTKAGCSIARIWTNSSTMRRRASRPAPLRTKSSGMHRLALERVELAARLIDPVFLHTPQFVCEPLSAALGVRVALKIETLNPIRSFKGRGADFLVSQASNDVPLVCASAGNFGQAMAYACRKHGLKLTIYASTNANSLKVERMQMLGANVVLQGA